MHEVRVTCNRLFKLAQEKNNNSMVYLSLETVFSYQTVKTLVKGTHLRVTEVSMKHQICICPQMAVQWQTAVVVRLYNGQRPNSTKISAYNSMV